jgi:hypothetical protein
LPKRDAELELITCLQDAVLRATSYKYKLSWTAHHEFPGPFARMAQQVLNLVGAGHADAVGLINELDKRRRKMGWQGWQPSPDE